MRSLVIASLLCLPVLLCAMATPAIAEEGEFEIDRTNTESIKKYYKINTARADSIREDFGDDFKERSFDNIWGFGIIKGAFTYMYRIYDPEKIIRDPNTGKTYKIIKFGFGPGQRTLIGIWFENPDD